MMRIKHHLMFFISHSRHWYDPDFALASLENLTLANNSPFGPTGSGHPRLQAGHPRLQAGLAQQNDVVDAEFETISDVSTTPNNNRPVSNRPVGKNWAPSPSLMRKSLAMRQTAGIHETRFFEKTEEKSWVPWNGEPLSTPAFYTLAVAIMVVSFWVSGGHNLFVSEKPERPVSINTENLVLDVRDVTWDIRYRATKPILFVNGSVFNPHESANPPQNIVVLAKYKNGKQEKLFIPGHEQPLQPFADYQFHGQLDLKHSEIASVSVELQKP